MEQSTLASIIEKIETGRMPEWWVKYADQLAYNLQVHTKGLMFDKIIGLYPNEHPDSQKHCINSYESVTKGSIWKAINNIIRIFSNSSYNIHISDTARKIIEDYQIVEGSLFSNFLNDWIKNAVASDPNGICVVYPPEYKEGELYEFINHSDIIYMEDDALIFISEDESESTVDMIDVEYAKEIFFDYEHADGALNVRRSTVRTFNRRLERRYTNKVYHVFTNEYFIRVFKTDPSQKNYEYEYIKFKSAFDSIPYFVNGGNEIDEDVYESFVQSFIPFGNLALMSHRNHRAVDLMFSYPRMSEVQQPCDECNGTGHVKDYNSTTGYGTCKVCKGSKYVTIQSPYKVYRKVNDSFDTDGKAFSTPSVEFYSPDAAILDYSKQEWKTYLEQAEMAVFIQQKTQTGNVQAAQSKQIDREELYAWLSNIADVLYGNIEKLLQYIENYISTNPIKASVEKPYSYAILTESEAFDALNTMLASSAPVMLKASQIDNFVNKFVSESSPVKRALRILKKYDLLLYYSNNDVNTMKGNGFVDQKMCQKHILAYPILTQMYETDKTIFDLEDDQIISMLDAEVAKYDMTTDLRTRAQQLG